jgi:hypothetical protein
MCDRVPKCSAECLRVQLSPCVCGRVPACLAEYLRVWPSPCMFDRVPGRSVESLDGLLTRSWEVILANVKQSARLTLEIPKSLYPLVDFNAVGDGSDLVSTLCSY